ncbi:hypothetical protein [Nocardia amamiensis]|uniref:hypothetical protein n=1 Tax=Nocardia amamiensis TaxID=404578 RepID=UPI0012F505EF|nr:hypothetical protein [Nocardia amamiensis]
MHHQSRLSATLDYFAMLREILAADIAVIYTAAGALSNADKAGLARRLHRVADLLTSGIGDAHGDPPPPAVFGAGTQGIDVAVRLGVIPEAQAFVERVLQSWRWSSLIFAANTVVADFVASFVEAVDGQQHKAGTRMAIRLRAVSGGHLVIEAHDSIENARYIADVKQIVQPRVRQISARWGRYCTGERTVVWAELAPPGL